MKPKSHMSISEFAQLTGIKRANLIFYDNIGLLSPELRGENGYRYYTRRQMGSAYLISDLRYLGVGLDEIRQYASVRTPERMMELFEIQEKRIKEEMIKLRDMREMIGIFTEMAQEALKYEDVIRIQTKGHMEEAIFLGPELEKNLSEEAGVVQFYEYAEQNGVGLDYPLGVVIAKENLEAVNITPVQQYYFLVKRRQNGYKPAGQYAVAYGRCALGKSEYIYTRLLEYIKEHGMRICGDAYEEYPLNEISIQDEEQYCVKVEILVENFVEALEAF